MAQTNQKKTAKQKSPESSKPISLVKSIYYFEEAIPVLEKANENSLVLFDVDLVLQHPQNKNFQGRTLLQYQNLLHKAIGHFTPEEKDRFLLSLVFGKPLELIEPQAPQLIKDLQKKKVKTLIFTGFATGDILGSWIPQWRFESLRGAGIDCSQFYDAGSLIWLRNYKQYLNSHPLYYKGILFSNGHYAPHTKADVLFTFLKHIKWLPEEIIFFDDRLDNILSVKDSPQVKEEKINYYGFNYKGGYLFPKEIPVHDAIREDWVNAETYFRGFQIEYPPG